MGLAGLGLALSWPQVYGCVNNPAAYNTSATGGALPTLCNEIVSSALYGPSRERWFFRPENAPWNNGAPSSVLAP